MRQRGSRPARPRKAGWIRAHDVTFLPTPPPAPVQPFGYHGPTGDTADPEAVRLVVALEELRRQYGLPDVDGPED